MGKKKGSKDHAEWLASIAERRRRCYMCHDVARPELAAIIQAIRDSGTRISLNSIYRRLCEISKGLEIRVGYYAFRNHISVHEPLFTGSRRVKS